jgi:hypothetical protein
MPAGSLRISKQNAQRQEYYGTNEFGTPEFSDNFLENSMAKVISPRDFKVGHCPSGTLDARLHLPSPAAWACFKQDLIACALPPTIVSPHFPPFPTHSPPRLAGMELRGFFPCPTPFSKLDSVAPLHHLLNGTDAARTRASP